MASKALLKSAPKATAPVATAPVAKKGGLAAIAGKAKTVPAAPVAEAPEEAREVDIAKMKGPELDALVTAEKIEVPEDWAKLSLAKKKEWIYANVAKDADGTEAEPAKPAKAARVPKPAKEEPKFKTAPVPHTITKMSADKAAKALHGEVITSADAFGNIINYVENLTEEAAKGLVGSLAEGDGFAKFKLGGVLARIQEQGWFAPYASFKEYVETDQNLKYRDAAYMTKIYNDLARLNISYDRVKSMQWTKLRTVSEVLTPDNIEKWVKIAEKQTVVQLMETVKAHKMKGKVLTGAADPKTVRTMTFKVHGDQDQTISLALAKAKEMGATETATVALEYICQEFMGTSKASLTDQLKQVGVDVALEALAAAFPDTSFAVEMNEAEEKKAA